MTSQLEGLVNPTLSSFANLVRGGIENRDDFFALILPSVEVNLERLTLYCGEVTAIRCSGETIRGKPLVHYDVLGSTYDVRSYAPPSGVQFARFVTELNLYLRGKCCDARL